MSVAKYGGLEIYFNILQSFPLIFKLQYSDMNDEMRTEAMELCVTACEKFSANNEVCVPKINESDLRDQVLGRSQSLT